MTNMILYEFAKNKEYTLKNLVNDYEKNLQDDAYQDRLAWGIYNGIMSYFE